MKVGTSVWLLDCKGVGWLGQSVTGVECRGDETGVLKGVFKEWMV